MAFPKPVPLSEKALFEARTGNTFVNPAGLEHYAHVNGHHPDPGEQRAERKKRFGFGESLATQGRPLK